MPLPPLTTLEAERAGLESQISETEDQLRRLLSQSEIRPTKTDILASPYLFRPTVQIIEIPTKHFAQTEDESKLVSPPKPTLHLRPPHSPLPAPRQSPLKTQMDMVTLQVLQEQTSKQIQDLQRLIRTQLELQQSLAQQPATSDLSSRQPAAVDMSSRQSPLHTATPCVPPGFKPLTHNFEKMEEHRQFTSPTMEQIDLAQTPIPRLTSTSKKSRKLRINRTRNRQSSFRHDNTRRGNPALLPKNLFFNGKTSRFSFIKMFESYRSVFNWGEQECKDYLTWSLEGKAMDFFTITIRMDEEVTLEEIIKKLESRFGSVELIETARVNFQQASQHSEETLEDWADRAMTLATVAYKDLPESHRIQGAVAKFSQGCLDKEAAKHACLEHPKNIQEALNLVKHDQYITRAVDGQRNKSRKSTDHVSVNQITLKEVKKLIDEAIKAAQGKGKAKPTDPCFFCKKVGHFKKDCKKYKAWLQKKNKDTQHNLNG